MPPEGERVVPLVVHMPVAESQTAGAPPQEKAAQPWLAAVGNSLPAVYST